MTSWGTQFAAGDIAWLLLMAIVPLILTTAGMVIVLQSRFPGDHFDRVWARLPVLIAATLTAWGLGIYSLAFGPSWGTVPRTDPNQIQPMRSMQEIAEDDFIGNEGTDSFGRGGVIGGLEYVALQQVIPVARTEGPQFPVRRPHTHVPHILECLFRATSLLLALVPLWLVWSRRFRGVWLGVVGILWSCLVYAPIAHWVWGDGWLGDLGTIDFGGGLLVIAVACSCQGPIRRGSDERCHDVDFDAGESWGALLFWLGGALFISAQTFHADGRAAVALGNVLWGTSTCILVWCFSNGFVWKAPRVEALGVGVAAGVVGIAPAAGVVQPQAAMITGALVGFLANLCLHLGRRRAKTLTSPVLSGLEFSTLGIAAAVGMLSAGVFATTSVAGQHWDGRPILGVIEGAPLQIVYQAAGVVSVAAWALVISWLLEYATDQCQRWAGSSMSEVITNEDDDAS